MTGPRTIETTSVARAFAELRDDHRRLEELLERLRTARDLPLLVSTLKELNSALVAHFAREEHPGGLYDVLGVCAPQHRAPLRELVDEHYRILGTVRELVQRTRELEERFIREREEVLHLADRLREHETREHALAREALGPDAGEDH